MTGWLEGTALKNRGIGLASTLCLLGLGACGSGTKAAGGSSLTGIGGSGGGSGSSGTLCLTSQCPQGSAQIAGSLAARCIADCGDQRPASALQLDTSWTRAAEAPGGWALFMAGAGTPVDGQPTPVSYAVFRVGDVATGAGSGGAGGGDAASSLDGHWICATGGTLTPYTYSADNPTPPQPFTLTGLSDMGTCEGNDSSPDTLTLELTGSASTITGSVRGQAVSLQGRSPSCTTTDCSLDVATDSPFAGSYFSMFSEQNDTGAPVPLSDAIWVAPRDLGVDVVCGSSSSTITRAPYATADTAHVEMEGLQTLHCPGTPLAGELGGQL